MKINVIRVAVIASVAVGYIHFTDKETNGIVTNRLPQITSSGGVNSAHPAFKMLDLDALIKRAIP